MHIVGVEQKKNRLPLIYLLVGVLFYGLTKYFLGGLGIAGLDTPTGQVIEFWVALIAWPIFLILFATVLF